MIQKDQKDALGLFYPSYIKYLSACIFALTTRKNTIRLQQAREIFLDAVDKLLNSKKFDELDALIESISQLTQSIHQLAKTGFSSEVRGMIHDPLEDILNTSIRYLNSLDPKAKNDPILFVLESEIESLYEVQLECEDEEFIEDAEALSTLLSHIKDLTLCLHSLGSI